MPSQRALPIVNITALTRDGNPTERREVLEDLHQICRKFGAVTITGHNVPQNLLEEAFHWSERLYSLPHEEKMKAPHPPEPTPHRGYSHVGLEKVYSKQELDDALVKSTKGQSLREVTDCKESYEIGSQENQSQPNIWLPGETLPGFREFMTEFYWVLDKVAKVILRAIGESLGLENLEQEQVARLHSGHNNQLRLLHYPPTPTEQLESSILARMPAHTDFSSFTFLFQDDCGGLEFENPAQKGDFLAATPQSGTLVLNIGDMVQRISNDVYPSATHRVTLPPARKSYNDQRQLTEARYSIVYFVCPDESATIESVPSLVGHGASPKFPPINYGEYGASLTKYQYKGTPA
ncbi:MAG: hypothetical protein M1820_002276 [Bogoriella megaspora]|nr:MAG: hypothetical protein M1820_002276 [Bogoriella megaspora]